MNTLLVRYNLPRIVAFLHCLLGAHYSKPLNHDVTFSVSHLHHHGTSCQLPENVRFVLIEGRRFLVVLVKKLEESHTPWIPKFKFQSHYHLFWQTSDKG